MGETLVLHDLAPNQTQELEKKIKSAVFFAAQPSIKPCIGCFGCWVKTPGQCVLPGRGQEFLPLLAHCDELVIVSRIVFGMTSPDVKAVLDRSIGYMLPYFKIVQGEMHHAQRYEQPVRIRYLFYGPCSNAEKQTAQQLAAANALNFSAPAYSVQFAASPKEIAEVL